MDRIHFAREGAFYATLRKRVDAALAEAGKPKDGAARIALKSLFCLGLLASSYVTLVFVAVPVWAKLLSAFLVAQSIVLIGFCVMHDAGHGAFSKHRWVNRLMVHSLDLIGGSQALWKYKHNILHHTFTNLEELDDDLDTNGLLRLHPEQEWKPHHRFQILYALPAYSLITIHWIISDFPEFFGGKIGRHDAPKRTPMATAVFLGFKALYVVLAFVIPFALHTWWHVLAVWVGIQLIAGFTFSLVFQLAHVVEGVDFPSPVAGERRVEDSWAVHQLATTVDFAPGNPFVSWYTGGLNHQVTHHLFTKVSHVRYGVVQPIVEETAIEFGYTYKKQPSVMAAIGAHLRMIAELGRKPAEASVPARAAA
ncbi:MAG: acyl-CoA desaturase [Myxococcota bacterium]